MIQEQIAFDNDSTLNRNKGLSIAGNRSSRSIARQWL